MGWRRRWVFRDRYCTACTRRERAGAELAVYPGVECCGHPARSPKVMNPRRTPVQAHHCRERSHAMLLRRRHLGRANRAMHAVRAEPGRTACRAAHAGRA